MTDVGERRKTGAALFCKLRRRKRIRRFPALTDGENERTLGHDGIAVTVFARKRNAAGNAADLLESKSRA